MKTVKLLTAAAAAVVEFLTEILLMSVLTCKSLVQMKIPRAQLPAEDLHFTAHAEKKS